MIEEKEKDACKCLPDTPSVEWWLKILPCPIGNIIIA